MLDQQALDTLFYHARTYNAWKPTPVETSVLEQLYNLTVLGPTSANCLPMRVLFLTSPQAKERLKPALDPGNIEKTMLAPVTALIAYDEAFFEHLPTLFPQTDAKSWFAGNPPLAKETAFRNSSLQGGYFILAARALGLDCGPMSGFDREKIQELFLKDTTYVPNFLCNLGYGDPEKLYPRNPRLSFSKACKIL